MFSKIMGPSSSLLKCLSAIFLALSITVSVFKPKKSNFTKPTASTSSLSNWVTKLDPSSSQYIGVKSVNTDGEITTPPACLPELRAIPSSFKPRSISCFTSSSSSYLVLRSSDSSKALVRVIPKSKGINLAIPSTKL